MEAGSEKFWLSAWLDEFEITTADQAHSLLRPGSPTVTRLHELAASVVWRPSSPYDGGGNAILAGRGIDLSGELDCCHRVCQRRQVDELFGRVLHYFDDTVISGPPAHRYAKSLEHPNDEVLHNLGEHASVLLYLREIGAEGMLRFIQKRPACSEHCQQHAAEAGIGHVVEAARAWIDDLARSGSIRELREHEDHWHYQFHHPAMEHSAWGALPPGRKGTRPSRREVAEAVFATYASYLVSDVLSARDSGLPLGASVRLHEKALERASQVTTEAAAFNLELPILRELPVRDVVKLRQDEWQYFEAFRVALTTAITERITGSHSPADVADKVYMEVIEPALVDLDRRLRTAERSLARKMGTSIGLGTLITSVGLLTGVPLIIGTGLAVMVPSSVSAAHKYNDDRGQMELSDMYFLWRLERKAA